MEGIASTAIDITEILRLMRHTDSGDYLQAPVVVADDDHWSGFRPDRIKALVDEAILPSHAPRAVS